VNTNSFDPNKFKDGQRQQWNGVAAGWKKWWETLERMAKDVTVKIIEMADIQPDQNVLDFATGIGEPALTVAPRVGEKGKVVATDVSSEMLSIARERAKELGVTNIEFQELDAEQINYPESEFDSIVCRWGLMFLPDVDGTLNSIHRMLITDGRFATAVWDEPEKIPFFSFAVHTLKNMFDLPQPPPDAPTMSGLADGVLEDHMERAGFRNIVSEKITVNFEFSSAGEYAQLMKDIAAPLTAMLTNQTPEAQAEYWQTLEESTAQKFASESGGVILPSVTLLAAGQK